MSTKGRSCPSSAQNVRNSSLAENKQTLNIRPTEQGPAHQSDIAHIPAPLLIRTQAHQPPIHFLKPQRLPSLGATRSAIPSALVLSVLFSP